VGRIAIAVEFIHNGVRSRPTHGINTVGGSWCVACGYVQIVHFHLKLLALLRHPLRGYHGYNGCSLSWANMTHLPHYIPHDLHQISLVKSTTQNR